MPRHKVAATLTEKIRNCYEQQFTGFLKITDYRGRPWYVYFLLGRITWAQSSKQVLRRWKRHLAVHSPVLSEQINEPVSLYYEYWNYAALSKLVKLKQFPREQFSKVVEGCITEVLFDILQVGIWQLGKSGELTIEEHKKEAAIMPFMMLENLQPWQKAQQDWQRWEEADLTKLSPNWAPMIKQPEELKAQTPLQTFQTLTSFANGENTLRDLAIRFKQPIIPIAKSIRPYVSRKLLEFVEIPDIVDSAHHGFHPEMMDVHQVPRDTDNKTDGEAATDSHIEIESPTLNLSVSEQANQDPSNQEQTDGDKTTANRVAAEGFPDTESAVEISSTNEMVTRPVEQELQSREPVDRATSEGATTAKIVSEGTAASKEAASKEAASKEMANQGPTNKAAASQEAASKKTASKETDSKEAARRETTVSQRATEASLATERTSELQDSMVYQKPSDTVVQSSKSIER